MGHDIYAKHLPYKNGHYAKVFNEALLNDDGPIIRVVLFDGDYCAVEGSHRLATAHAQGKEPRLIVVEPDLPPNEEWWSKIKPTLPVYHFEHVHVLKEADMLPNPQTKA